jgi:ubiquinone/menaquinone biosynthesis C-methylase UbiE
MSEIIADYTDFDYKKNFWTDGNREYEDRCDRLAIYKLLPKNQETIADVCGGFGRLVPIYAKYYKDLTLFDYAENLLAQARTAYGNRIKTVQGDAAKMPFADNQFDTVIFVRASHHFKEIKLVISELARIVKPTGKVIIEIANKRHVLQIIRMLFGKSKFNPFSLEVVSRNEKGFYNYHPKYVENIFIKHRLKIKRVLAVSNFRSNILKKVFGVKLLLFIESFIQKPLGFLKLSPSIYYLLEKQPLSPALSPQVGQGRKQQDA